MDETEVGSLSIFTAPMMGGKTRKLVSEMNRFSDVGLKVLCIGFSGDTRSEETLSTHALAGVALSPGVIRVKVSRLGKIDVSQYDVIGVDEAQFFGIKEPSLQNDLYISVKRWVVEQKKIVLLAGLVGDAKREPFGHLLELIPLADEVEFFTAYCVECLKLKRRSVVPARFTYRTASSSEQVLIGGSESYIPLCRRHYEALAADFLPK